MTYWELKFTAYYNHGWWDCIDPSMPKNNCLVGIYRMTEHGWWDVRTCYFKYDPTASTGNHMYLPVPEYTEDEVRRIVENSWAIKKGEPDD